MYASSLGRSRILIALGLFSLYASLSAFSALWPFMVESAGVDRAPYGGFVGAGNVLSIFARGLLMAANSPGIVVFAGALFSMGSAALLLGYTYHTIFSRIFQRMGFAASMMGRGAGCGNGGSEELARGLHRRDNLFSSARHAARDKP